MDPSLTSKESIMVIKKVMIDLFHNIQKWFLWSLY